MISSEIWCYKSSKFIKDQIFHEPVASAPLQNIAREIMLLLSNNIHEKGISQRQGKRNLAACPLFVICIHIPALHPCYMTNAPGFSQSEARKFFVYIFSIGNNMISSAIWC